MEAPNPGIYYFLMYFVQKKIINCYFDKKKKNTFIFLVCKKKNPNVLQSTIDESTYPGVGLLLCIFVQIAQISNFACSNLAFGIFEIVMLLLLGIKGEDIFHFQICIKMIIYENLLIVICLQCIHTIFMMREGTIMCCVVLPHIRQELQPTASEMPFTKIIIELKCLNASKINLQEFQQCINSLNQMVMGSTFARFAWQCLPPMPNVMLIQFCQPYLVKHTIHSLIPDKPIQCCFVV